MPPLGWGTPPEGLGIGMLLAQAATAAAIPIINSTRKTTCLMTNLLSLDTPTVPGLPVCLPTPVYAALHSTHCTEPDRHVDSNIA